MSVDKFDEYRTTQETALQLALERQDARLTIIERWISKASGVGIVLALFAGVIGAAIAKAIG